MSQVQVARLIGIVAGRPYHTTVRTGPYNGGSRWLRRHSFGRSNAQTDADKNHSEALAKHKPHHLAGARAEQDHDAIRRRVRARQGFRVFANQSFDVPNVKARTSVHAT